MPAPPKQAPVTPESNHSNHLLPKSQLDDIALACEPDSSSTTTSCKQDTLRNNITTTDEKDSLEELLQRQRKETSHVFSIWKHDYEKARRRLDNSIGRVKSFLGIVHTPVSAAKDSEPDNGDENVDLEKGKDETKSNSALDLQPSSPDKILPLLKDEDSVFKKSEAVPVQSKSNSLNIGKRRSLPVPPISAVLNEPVVGSRLLPVENTEVPSKVKDANTKSTDNGFLQNDTVSNIKKEDKFEFCMQKTRSPELLSDNEDSNETLFSREVPQAISKVNDKEESSIEDTAEKQDILSFDICLEKEDGMGLEKDLLSMFDSFL